MFGLGSKDVCLFWLVVFYLFLASKAKKNIECFCFSGKGIPTRVRKPQNSMYFLAFETKNKKNTESFWFFR